MKKILLLGGYGFIGTNLLKYIDTSCVNQFEVIVFDKFDKHQHGLTFNCIKESIAGDFNDSTAIESVFKKNKIDIVIHALSSTVPATSGNAKYDVLSNLIPTLNLIEIMNQNEVKDIVYLSSGGAIYGDYLNKVHNEDDAVYPKSSYGVVKLAIEKYLLSYSELYGFNTLILRVSNPYGKYHYNNKQGIINIAVRKALNKDVLDIWGDGKGLKDYIFVEDVCDIIMKMIKKGVVSNVLNVASGSILSINEIVKAVNNLIPKFQYRYVKNNIIDVQSFELDITKLRTILGGYKFTSFEQGLSQVIMWQKSVL